LEIAIDQMIKKNFLRYVGPERLFIYQKLRSEIDYIDQFFKFTEEYYSFLNLKEFKTEIMELDFRVKEVMGEKILVESESNWEFSDLSTGTQSTTLLEMYIKGVQIYLKMENPTGWKRDKWRILIEEPEQHLFPKEQFELVKFLVKNTNGITFITHSPYILFSLSLLMYAHYLGTNFPDRRKKVEKLIPAEYWLDPADFFGYEFHRNGEVVPIPQDEVGMITRDTIGKVKGELETIFDFLLEIEE
jgi:hypothetical protein